MAKITFLGAAGTVTGSKYLVEAEGKRLLVDCGLFQGPRELRQRNWDAAADRSGEHRLGGAHARAYRPHRLPAATGALRLSRTDLRECGDSRTLRACCCPIQPICRKKTRVSRRKRATASHKPPLPLYTVRRSTAGSRSNFEDIPRAEPFTISPQFTVRGHDAGHILGSSWLELTITENGKQTLVVFSGDVGRYGEPILNDPEPPTRADFLLCESTYGDRDHPAGSVADELADVMNRHGEARRSHRDSGVCRGPHADADVLPAANSKSSSAFRTCPFTSIARWPSTSPASTRTIRRTTTWNSRERKSEGNHDPLNVHEVHMTRTVEESKKINDVVSPCIIISASGMATGGRILHHLARRLPDSRSAVLLVGYQAEGIAAGARCRMARNICAFTARKCRCARKWSRSDSFRLMRARANCCAGSRDLKRAPRQTFLVHGEPVALDALCAIHQQALPLAGDDSGLPAIVRLNVSL